MFFVLNVGRSGSRSVAQVLSQSPDCTCQHEPHPRLLAETHGYLAGTVPHDEMVRLLRDSRSSMQVDDGQVHGESANRLSLVVPALREAFPDADLVWLVRDGRAMVSSALQRGWYSSSDHPDRREWDRTRPTAVLTGDADQDTWTTWSPFERLCWYWSTMNRRIRDHAGEAFLVRIEDLAERVEGLATHLGITPVDHVITRANRRWVPGTGDPAPHAVQANAVDHVFTVEDWTDDQHDIFERHCGVLMDELYPDWRETPPPGPPAPPTPTTTDRATDSGVLAAVHEQLGELRIFQQELSALRRERDDLRDELARLQRQVASHETGARAARRHQEHLQDQLGRAREELDGFRDQWLAERAELKAALAEARDRATREQQRRQAITDSRTFRAALVLRRGSIIGHRLVDGMRSVVGRGATTAEQAPAELIGGSSDGLSVDDAATMVDGPIVTVPDAHGSLDTWAVYGLVVFDTTPSDLGVLVDAVRDLQRRHPGMAVFFVTDSEAFHVFRSAGVVFEHIPPRARWERHGTGSYDEFRADRLALLEVAYRPDRMLPMDASAAGREASLAVLEAETVARS